MEIDRDFAQDECSCKSEDLLFSKVCQIPITLHGIIISHPEDSHSSTPHSNTERNKTL